MDEFDKARTAGIYFQTFIRANIADWSELKQHVNPRQGYGDGEAAHRAFDIANWLFDFADVSGRNCRVPEDYASASDLGDMLERFGEQLAGAAVKLKADIETTGRRGVGPETSGMVLARIGKAQHAVAEAVRQLGPVSNNPAGEDHFAIVAQIAERFGAVVRTLKSRRKGRAAVVMNDEYDVQYLFEALLNVPFRDVRSEENGRSVAGGASRADSFLGPQRCIVEYKMTRTSMTNASLRKELADDFLIYGARAECDDLFVFVHDPGGIIANPDGFETDMSQPVHNLKRVRTVVR